LYINLFYAIQDVHVCWNRVITESVTVLKSPSCDFRPMGDLR
jgi:hypothetical protein